MKIVCVMVATVNGKTTNASDPHVWQWTSKEDQAHFSSLIQESTCIVMGSSTYEAAKDMMQHSKGRLRVIMTRHPEKYQEETIPGQLEFTSEEPAQLVHRLESQGIEKILLAGGAMTNAAFLHAGFIDELWLTLEPKLFGMGNPLFAELDMQKNMQLLSMEKMNEQGTLLLKYQILQ